ncbi:hypothetical protein [Streptobacillus moniliformis]|uniref:hypothetical protein n=1 Tax=Streptobacillus moniliformis TaxID=34105 RepID=UPI0007E3B4BA|nr:hypothetical protein [Streptobacillus moniliformis]
MKKYNVGNISKILQISRKHFEILCLSGNLDFVYVIKKRENGKKRNVFVFNPLKTEEYIQNYIKKVK